MCIMSAYIVQTYDISNVAMTIVSLLWIRVMLGQSVDCIISLVESRHSKDFLNYL